MTKDERLEILSKGTIKSEEELNGLKVFMRAGMLSAIPKELEDTIDFSGMLLDFELGDNDDVIIHLGGEIRLDKKVWK